MKASTIILLAALTLAVAAPAKADPPVLLGWSYPPSEPVRREGPFRFGIMANWRAETRLTQGFYAMPVLEDGQWWVDYYPWFREPPPSPRIGWLRLDAGSGPACSGASATDTPPGP